MTIARERNARGSGEQLREQLIAAANDLLVRPQRLSVPSLRAVARACGVSPAAVYLHFDSVEALILAVIEAQYDDLGASLAAAREGMMPGPELLIAAGLGYAEWGLAHPGAYQLLFESADELQLATTVDLEGARGWDLIEELAGEVARSTSNGQQQSIVLAVRLWTALHGIVSLRMHKSDHEWPTTIETEVRELVALIPV